MKILLLCSVGMSTSLIVTKMKEALGPDEKDWVIEAKPVEKFKNEFKKYDVILLGPQIWYKKDEFQKKAEKYGIPVGVIQATDYGLAKGENILEFAKRLHETARRL